MGFNTWAAWQEFLNMVQEEPHIFLHYWGIGPAEQLARGLRAVLDQTKK